MECEIFAADVEQSIKAKAKDVIGLNVNSKTKKLEGLNSDNIKTFVQVTNNNYQSSEYGNIVSLKDIGAGKVQLEITVSQKMLDKYNDGLVFNLTKRDEIIIDEIKKEKAERAKKGIKIEYPADVVDNLAVPVTDNFIELVKHKQAVLKQVEKKIKDLGHDRHAKSNAKIDIEKITSEIARLTLIEQQLKQDIEGLSSKEPEFLFHAIIQEVDDLYNVLDPDNENVSINDIAESKRSLDFLSSFVKSKDLRGSTTDSKGLRHFNHPLFDKLNSDVDELIRLREKKQSFLMKKLFEDNIIFVNNVAEKVDKKTMDKIKYDLENMEKVEDIGIFSKFLYGVGDSFTNDTIITQIAKTYLETRIAIRESQANKWKDKLNSLISKIPGSFDFIYEYNRYGVKTGNIISPITDIYREQLKEYYNINKMIKANDLESQKYKRDKKLDWLKKNSFIIDPTMIKSFKDEFTTDEYPDNKEFYTHTDAEMAEYEKRVRAINPAMFEQVKKEMLVGLRNFENDKAILMRSTKGYKNKNIAQMNPYLFFSQNKTGDVSYKNDYGKKATAISNMKHVYFMPLEKRFIGVNPKTLKNMYEPTNFFNKDFDEIAKDKNKLEYWETITEIYTEYIHPTFSNSYSDPLSYAKFESNIAETLLDPNVKLFKNGLKIGKGVAARALFEAKAMFYEKGKYSENTDVLKSYSDNTKKEVKAMEIAMQNLTREDLQELADDLELDISKMTNKVAIEQLALTKVLDAFSNNFNFNTIALISMTSLQKAREDAAPVADMLFEYKAVKEGFKKDGSGKANRQNSQDKFNNWIKVIVKNQTQSYRGSNDFLGKPYLKKSIFEKILSWFGSIKWVKNYINEKSIDLMNENDKFLFKNLKKAQERGFDKSKVGGFMVGNSLYAAIKEEGDTVFIRMEDEVRYEISEQDLDNAFQEHIKAQITELGLDWTISGMIEGVLKIIIRNRLGLNPLSGAFNRIEGKSTSLIMDATGNYWKRGNIQKASWFLAGANILHYFDLGTAGVKYLPGMSGVDDINITQNIKQMRVFKAMMDKMNIMQDRKNELDKANQKSTELDTSALNIYQFAVDRPEFKNQGEIFLSVLMDTTIRSKDGKIKTSIFDGDTGTFPAHELVDGKLVLKEEFRTLENIGNWENFAVDEVNLQNNSYLTTKLKVKRAISKTQGNYDPQDTLYITKNVIGRAASMFLKWLPEHFMQRFGYGETFDLVNGKMSPKGRFRVLFGDNATLTTALTMVSVIGLGPSVVLGSAGAVALGIGGILAAKWGYRKIVDTVIDETYGGEKGIKRALAEMLKVAGFTQEVLKQTLYYPLEITNIKAGFNRYNKYSFNDNKVLNFIDMSLHANRDKTNLTIEQANNFSAVAKDLAIMINYTMMLVMLALAYYDEDDDEESERRKRYNMMHNLLARMKNSISVYLNPIDFTKDVTRNSFLGWNATFIEVLVGLAKNEADEKLGKKALKLAPIPGLSLIGLTEDDKAFNDDPYSELTIKMMTGIDKDARGELAADKKEAKKEITERLTDKYPGIHPLQLKRLVNTEYKQLYPTAAQIRAKNKAPKLKKDGTPYKKTPRKPKSIIDLTPEQEREKTERDRDVFDAAREVYEANKEEDDDNNDE